LRTGIGKGRILAEIAQSEEARKRGVSLHGLDALLAAQVNTEGLGLRATAERTVRIERHGNRLENELGRAQERLATLEQAIVAGMPRAEHNFEELRSLVQQHVERVRGEFERVTELLTEVKKEVLQIRTDRDGSPRMAIDELMAKVTSETERFRA
jgi:predicted  nucleic acid-binding Zn-ribbon protein